MTTTKTAKRVYRVICQTVGDVERIYSTHKKSSDAHSRMGRAEKNWPEASFHVERFDGTKWHRVGF